ncbi:Shr3 amino acid permease chaperone [Rhizodiscina lignyota]|uniref:Shr3 amino acid permease chaperone n=1 Tax=Rhizodiscina lignyota TaxID=1504668 RepID=A0A9P4M5D3_9PEZI|nr:Shr3 amino acid permease chaperone [Rhizodiscina lignyota]
MAKSNSFATFLIIGPTCFFLGVLFILLPYDYHILWAPPSPNAPPGKTMEDYFLLQETHLKFLHASPPLVPRIQNLIVGVGLLGFIIKLYKPSEANLLFDGASLVLYMVGITVYIANIVKGLRMVTAGEYGSMELVEAEAVAGSGQVELEGTGIGREDSLRVLAASNTILALVLVGVLVLQAGQWYAERKEEDEMAEMDQKAAEKKRTASSSGSSKKNK